MLAAALALASSLLPQGIEDTVQEICARSGGTATVERIGDSRGGRPILAMTLARRGGTPLTRRPALLIVAGTHGHHRLGTELALHHAAALLDGAGEDGPAPQLLDRCAVYIVPQLNPDGAALGRIGNARALDLDRDGKNDEDPPDDLDGDGQIAQMRWPDPEGTWILDPDDPRLLRKADRDSGERGTHMLAREGRDNDGDEDREEDPAEGVAVHRGFAHDFAAFDRQAGSIPVGEPEARALADFVFARPHIGMAFVYGIDNNLVGKIKTDAGKGRAILKGVLDGDKKLYAAAAELYQELTGRKGDARDRHDGSVWSWLHFHVGIPTFATDVWQMPTEAPKKAKSDKAPPDDGDEKHVDEKTGDKKTIDEKTGDKKTGKRAEPNPDAHRLAHCQRVGRGFVPWQKLDHPELGEVEVGGFVEGLDWALVPEDERAGTFATHHDFVVEVAGWLPRCTIEELTATRVGDGVYEIEAAIVNTGRLDALTAMSARSRRFSTPRLLLDTGDATLAAGELRLTTRNLEGAGGRQQFRWILTGAAGTVVRLELVSDFSGRDTAEVTL